MNTPTPWKIAETAKNFVYASNEDGWNRMDFVINPGLVSHGQHTTAQELEANAALIVRAVNSHQSLVDALEWYVKHDDTSEADGYYMAGFNAAADALKLARGES